MTDTATVGPGAIAFTDIVGFTEFTADRGDGEAVALLDLQGSLVQAALPRSARVVKELGDGLMLWLPDPRSAVATGLSLLDRFNQVSDDVSPLWVRIGMHWGRPTRRGEDLVGHDVNLASRIVDVAGPGELLISSALHAALDTGYPDICVKELGPVVMRGIPAPVPLFKLSRLTVGRADRVASW
jgi:adenylate cyclase